MTEAPTPPDSVSEGGSPHVSIVVPAYNEEARLPSGLERLIRFLGAQAWPAELVVSNDGSTDRTADIVRDAAATSERVAVRLVENPQNMGKGAAIRAGALAARGRFVFYMDADLATPPEDALRLLERLDAGAPVAIGTRIQPNGADMRATQPTRRRMVGRLFTTLRKTMRVLPDIDDTQCPMKAFRHDVAQAVFERQQLSGWIFDAEVLCIARSLGYAIVQVPVSWTHVEGSRLKVRPSEAWGVFRDLLRLRSMHHAAPPAHVESERA